MLAVFRFLVTVLLLLSGSAPSAAAEPPAPPTTVIDVRVYGGQEVIVRGYTEKRLTDRAVVYVDVAKSRSFEALTVGPAYYLTPELQLGLSFGLSRYPVQDGDEKATHPTVSGFFYCLKPELEASLTVERYGRDPAPWYFCAYSRTPVAGRVSAGFHAESGVGVGPLVSWSAAKNVEFFAAPIVWREADTRLVVGSQLSF